MINLQTEGIERGSRMRESANLAVGVAVVAGLALSAPINAYAAAGAIVGTVTKGENQAQIGTQSAVVGTHVHMNDRLRTGATARLQVTLHDNSSLVLGENANVVIDRFVFDPAKSSADVVLKATRGALRFAGGKIEQMQHKNIIVD